MMKKLYLILAFVFAFSAIFLFPATSLADHDDFDISYTVAPTLAGYKGADINIQITVQNRGATNITWLDVSVTTVSPYNQHWTGTIAPGASRSLSFIVHFTTSDFDTDKLLYVKMNNDGDSESDGTQVRTFSVASTHDIFQKSWSISPDRDEYNVGDTVTITHTFRNTFTGNAATGFSAQSYLSKEPECIFTGPLVSPGMVMPGGTVSTSFTYTFTEAYVGHLRASYHIEYNMMGEHYDESAWTLDFDVAAPEPDIDFTASLSADHTTIDAGGTVHFTIDINNRGDDIDRFVILYGTGGVASETEAMPSGGSGFVTLTDRLYDSADVRYYVLGYVGDSHVPIATNTVHITVREPEESAPASSAPSASASVPPSPSGEVSAAPTVSGSAIEPSAGVAPAEVSVSPEADESAAPADAPVQPRGDGGLLLYVIIGVLGAIILAGVIAIPLMLRKRSKA